MNFTIFKLYDVDLEKLVYLDPIKNPNNNTIFIPTMLNHNNKRIHPLIQVPSIKLCDNYKNNILICPLVGLDEEKTNIIRKFFNSIDNKVINDFKKYGKTWCPNIKNISYKAIVSEIDEENSITQYTNVNEVITFNLFNKDKDGNITFFTKVYDAKKNIITPENIENYLQRGNIIQSIIELRGINITLENNNLEVQFIIRTHQIRVTETYKDINIESYSFLDSEIEPQISNVKYNKNKHVNQMVNIQENYSSDSDNIRDNLKDSEENSENSENSESSKSSNYKEKEKKIIDTDSSSESSESINLNHHLKYNSEESTSISEDADEIIKTRFFTKY